MSEIVSRYRAARKSGDLVVLEGLHAVKHALRFGARLLEARSPDPAAALALARELAPDVAPDLDRLLAPTAPETFRSLAPAPPPTRVIALAHRPDVDLEDLMRDPDPAPVVVLERPTHHGNIGAVVRVAAAAGAAGVLVTGPHDPWHAAAVRGGAGLQFALPVARVQAVPFPA
ncbi:MAG TPA: TrmH family RNA methyltransferase, partial [Longimicrobiales bacterium]|nr:TrmH family RNA methyltransferase [Longimicrobiales bacterium]